MEENSELSNQHSNTEATAQGASSPESSNTMFSFSETMEETPENEIRKKARVPKSYPCSRTELYPVCELMMASLEEKLADFSEFSPSYDKDFVKTLTDMATAVQALPDETERTEKHRSERTLVEEACITMCSTGWQRLKRYIIRAKFSNPEAKLDLAGQKLYKNASDFDWVAAQTLAVAAIKFLDAHTEDLKANRNMPETFPAQFKAYCNTFNERLKRFRNFAKATEELTDQKMTAENELYLKTIEVGLDGQEIYKKDPASARLFSFAAVCEAISGIGSASLKGAVTDSTEKQPLSNATVFIKEKNLTVFTDAKGKYAFNRLASGIYTVQVSAPGYLSVTMDQVLVDPGTGKRANVALQKAQG